MTPVTIVCDGMENEKISAVTRALDEGSRNFHNHGEGTFYRVSSKTVYTVILLFSRVPYYIQKNF